MAWGVKPHKTIIWGFPIINQRSCKDESSGMFGHVRKHTYRPGRQANSPVRFSSDADIAHLTNARIIIIIIINSRM